MTASKESLSGLRALVTGGGSGLGLIMAQALARAGAAVAICGRRTDVIENAVKQLRAEGGEANGFGADVSSAAGIANIKDSAGPIDILVNNAGYSIRKNSWLEVTPTEWQEVLTINLQAPFMLAQAFVPAMMERGWGRVINIASVYGVVASDPTHYPDMASDNTSYVASKHGLIGMSKNLAMRVAHAGVTVNIVSPGIFPEVSKQQRSDGVVPGALTAQRLREAIPEARFGTAADLQSLVVFIASRESAYVNGHNFVVDGGFTLG